MAVKIFIKRKINKDALKDAPAMLIQARKNAMSNKGYISTETLVNCDDPSDIVVVSMWQKREDWDAYASSSERQANEQNFSALLADDTTYEIYNMGM
ncbi:MAG: antibiotic biosynthesis monooxygenase family protein [Desulfocapsaceae bacterium]